MNPPYFPNALFPLYEYLKINLELGSQSVTDAKLNVVSMLKQASVDSYPSMMIPNNDSTTAITGATTSNTNNLPPTTASPHLNSLQPQHSRNDTNTSLPPTGPVLRHTRAISTHSQKLGSHSRKPTNDSELGSTTLLMLFYLSLLVYSSYFYLYIYIYIYITGAVINANTISNAQSQTQQIQQIQQQQQQQSPAIPNTHSQQSMTSIQTNPSSTHHQHQISLSGLETIREKKSEDLPAVPPTTSESLLLRHGNMAPPHVKILSTRSSMISQVGDGGHRMTDSRYSQLSAFTPLRQHSLIGRMSFSNRRRSSVNMKSKPVPRFLAISPAQSFAASLPKQSPTGHIIGKDSMMSKTSIYGNKRHQLKQTTSASAVLIPFDNEQKMMEPEIDEEEQKRDRGLSTVPSQETLTIPRASAKITIDNFDDKDFDQRMKSSPLIFYDLTIVDKYKKLVFDKVTGHAIENGVTLLLAPSNIDTQPLLRAIAGIYSDELLYMEGKIIIKGKELLTELKLAQKRIIAYVPSDPVLPDLITVQEIVRLAFILTEPENNNDEQIRMRNTDPNNTENVYTILKTMELTHLKDMLVSQLSSTVNFIFRVFCFLTILNDFVLNDFVLNDK